MLNSRDRDQGKRIGVLGGTFNPIHTGHLLLGQAALNEYNLDSIMFLPSGKSYMKDDGTIYDAMTRMKMVELAIADNPKFFTSDMELKRAGNTYTCDTMKQLKTEYPLNSFYFICGADCLFSIEKWRNPQVIFDNCTILAAVRNGVDITQIKKKCEDLMYLFQGKAFPLPFPEVSISSTDIRKNIALSKSIRYMVPDEVRRYIEENGLYSPKMNGAI